MRLVPALASGAAGHHDDTWLERWCITAEAMGNQRTARDELFRVAIESLQAFNELSVLRRSDTLPDRFARLAREWRADTEFTSSIHAMAEPPAYQEIIALGPAVVRLVLAELRDHGGVWFPALRALTGVNPVPLDDRGNIAAMRKAWMEWGRTAGLID